MKPTDEIRGFYVTFTEDGQKIHEVYEHNEYELALELYRYIKGCGKKVNISSMSTGYIFND